MTLEDLLKKKVFSTDKDNNAVAIHPEFRVSIQKVTETGIHFLIHPMNYDGETLDFICKGNSLKQI